MEEAKIKLVHGRVAERFKALFQGANLYGGVGSNPTSTNHSSYPKLCHG